MTESELKASNFMPDLVNDFKFTIDEAKTLPDKRCRWEFTGGEIAGKARLQNYLFGKWNGIATYPYVYTNSMDKELVGDEYRSELSPWLANGALSARYIYHECQRYKKENPG
jgi:deoxyribodipyrimidine photo-lyase